MNPRVKPVSDSGHQWRTARYIHTKMSLVKSKKATVGQLSHVLKDIRDYELRLRCVILIQRNVRRFLVQKEMRVH